MSSGELYQHTVKLQYEPARVEIVETSEKSMIMKLLKIICDGNVVVERLTPLLRIREAPRSKFGPKTGYHDSVFCEFTQSLFAKAGIIGLP